MAEIRTRFPRRCVKTNEPTDQFRTFSFNWHPPVLYFLLLLCGIPYAGFLLVIVAFAVFTRNAAFNIGMGSAMVRNEQRNIIRLGIAQVIVMSLFPLFQYFPDARLLTFYIPAFVFLIACAIRCLPQLTVRKIDKRFVYIKGAGKPFLESLPEFEAEE